MTYHFIALDLTRKILKNSFYNLSFVDLELLLETEGFNRSAAAILYNQHYKKKKEEQTYKKVAKETLQFLKRHLEFSSPKIHTVHQSKDRTVKFIFELHDGHTIESVLIPFHNKYSICLSSQVGCAMNCSFCFTGTQGFERNLSASEIVGQFLQAWRWIEKNRPGEERILNIVFMGQGEPLHNFNAVKKACEIFLSKHGASIGHQKITISTVGFLPGIKRWKAEMPGVNIALSLHSPFSQKRDQLIPVNRKFPLMDVLACIDDIPLSRKQFVTYEYLIIKDFNDGESDAEMLGNLLKGKPAYINLIPFNPFPDTKYKAPSLREVERFKTILDRFKIPTLIRATKGDDVLAACGQLKSMV